MSFAPFDTSLVIARLKAEAPLLQQIGGAADYAAVKSVRDFRTPAAFVIFGEEQSLSKAPPGQGMLTLEAGVEVGVVYALRHFREDRGQQLADESRELIGQAREALVGWAPRGRGVRAFGWVGGKVIDYEASVLLFADVFRATHVMHKGAPAACGDA